MNWTYFALFRVTYQSSVSHWFIRLGIASTTAAQRTLRMHGGFLVLGITLLAFSNLTVSGQQPVKGSRGSLPKVATATKVNPPNAPSANDPQQLLLAAQAAQDQGRLDEAIQTYNRVIALSANQPQTAALANLKVGNVYMAQGKFANAQVAFERAVALNPGSAESHNNLGEALGELKQYQRALESFTRAASLDPKLPKAKYNQAVSYSRMGNLRYSEFVFRNLIKTNPNYGLAYDGLAVTLSRAGRAKEAIAFHEKAISLDPNEPSYYFNCAISYLMLKDIPKALEQQEKLKTINPAVADRLASVIIKHQM